MAITDEALRSVQESSKASRNIEPLLPWALVAAAAIQRLLSRTAFHSLMLNKCPAVALLTTQLPSS